MSTYFKFMAEAKYDGRWHNIDFLSQRVDGSLQHEYLANVSRSFLRYLRDFVDDASVIAFEQLAENTQKLLLSGDDNGIQQRIRADKYYEAGSIDDLEALLQLPVPMEYYVTPTQIAAYEARKIEEIEGFLTARELLELPATARAEYRLYRWYDAPDEYNSLKTMVDRAKEQLQCFLGSLPYQNGGGGKGTETRIIYHMW